MVWILGRCVDPSGSTPCLGLIGISCAALPIFLGRMIWWEREIGLSTLPTIDLNSPFLLVMGGGFMDYRKTMRYDDDKAPLILSDADILDGVPEPEEKKGMSLAFFLTHLYHAKTNFSWYDESFSLLNLFLPSYCRGSAYGVDP